MSCVIKGLFTLCMYTLVPQWHNVNYILRLITGSICLLKDASAFISLMSGMLVYPIYIRRHAGVDSRGVGVSTSVTPWYDSCQLPHSILLTGQWTTRITLYNRKWYHVVHMYIFCRYLYISVRVYITGYHVKSNTPMDHPNQTNSSTTQNFRLAAIRHF